MYIWMNYDDLTVMPLLNGGNNTRNHPKQL